MATTSAQRQREFRERMAKQGFQAVSFFVHERQRAAVLDVIRRLSENPDLEVGNLRNVRTGKYVKL